MAVNTRFIILCCWSAFQFWLNSEPCPIPIKSTVLRVFDLFCLGYSMAWMGLHVGEWPGPIAVTLWGFISGVWLYSPWFGIELDWAWEKLGLIPFPPTLNSQGTYGCDFNICWLVTLFEIPVIFSNLKLEKWWDLIYSKSGFEVHLNLQLWLKNYFAPVFHFLF